MKNIKNILKIIIKKILPNKVIKYIKEKKRTVRKRAQIKSKLLKIKSRFNIDISLKNEYSCRTPSKLPIDVVIPVAEKDITVLPYTINSIRNYIKHPIKNIFIISPHLKEIIELCKSNNVIFVEENSVLPIAKSDINYSVNGLDRSGWLFQQLLVLSSDKISKQENCLLVNADTIFIRPQVFEYNNKIIFNLSSGLHQPYFKTHTKLTGLEHNFPMSFIAHHMMMQKKKLNELQKLIERKHNKPWFMAIIENTDTTNKSGFAEQETYGNFVLSNYPDEIILEFWFNLSLPRNQLKDIKKMEQDFGKEYKSISFHNYL